MESWHLPINLSARLHQITSQRTWIFRIFREGMSPDRPSMSRIELSLWVLAPPWLTNKKLLGRSLKVIIYLCLWELVPPPPPVSQGIAPLLNNMFIFFHFILIQIHIDRGFLSTFVVILSTTCLGSKDVAVVRKQLTSFNVARAQILVATPNVGLVCCWFSLLLRGVFLQVLQFFPLVKKQLFQIPIRPGTHGRMSWNEYLTTTK